MPANCPSCPVGDHRCRGLIHARDCENARRGVPGYAVMLRRLAGLDPETPPPPSPPPAAGG